MIRFNEKDKFLTNLIREVNSLPIIRSIKNPQVLYVYGISKDRGLDVVLPNGFPNAKKLLDFFTTKEGMKTRIGCYWDLAEIYNYRVLGLGLGIRKTNRSLCQKVIVAAFLALNQKIAGQPSAKSVPAGGLVFPEESNF